MQIGAGLNLTLGSALKLGIRPEHVMLDPSGLPARVDLVEPTGDGIILHLSLGSERFKALTQDRTYLAPGEQLGVRFAAEHLGPADGTPSQGPLYWAGRGPEAGFGGFRHGQSGKVSCASRAAPHL
ncbi:TOBE domain-containing protein (plasmid) [Thioclava litoralis]|uniref:TOBE domain-containing protein n=1 Tax=Thioclava litoralis TaxID=3076557 RepID=A0ABZ1E4C8_9RHOB|nr:TOBE domain-containing protein [Thioclava sp. FTW29]